MDRDSYFQKRIDEIAERTAKNEIEVDRAMTDLDVLEQRMEQRWSGSGAEVLALQKRLDVTDRNVDTLTRTCATLNTTTGELQKVTSELRHSLETGMRGAVKEVWTSASVRTKAKVVGGVASILALDNLPEITKAVGKLLQWIGVRLG